MLKVKSWKKHGVLWGALIYGLGACTPAVDLTTPSAPSAEPSVAASPATPSTALSDLELPAKSTGTSGSGTVAMPSSSPSVSPAEDDGQVYRLQNILYWRVQAPDQNGVTGPVSYLVGTVHLNLAEGYQWPETFQQALTGADALYLEADTREIEQNPQAILEKTLDPEQTLVQSLDQDTLVQLAQRLSGIGVPPTLIPVLKPWYVNILLSAPPEAAVLEAETVMDNLLRARAEAANVSVRYLETALAQFEMMDAIPTAEHVRLIQETLQQPVARSAEQIQETVSIYNRGDLEALNRAVDELKAESMDFYQQSVVARNATWFELLQPVLTQESVVVGVGSLHLVGPDGLLNQLEAAGFRVTASGAIS